MTELEALKVAKQLLSTVAKGIGGFHGDWPKNAAAARDKITPLIERVDKATADPGLACEMAEDVMNENGQYATFVFNRAWLMEALESHTSWAATPNEEELDACAKWIMRTPDVGSTDAAYSAMEEWIAAGSPLPGDAAFLP